MSPEITSIIQSTGIAILIIYAGRLAWKFKTYGAIDGKVQKKHELEEIAKAEANGKNTIEFGYKKRIDDSERLISFGEDMFECVGIYMEESAAMCKGLSTFCYDSIEDPEKFKPRYFELKVIKQPYDKYTLLDKVELKYGLYFSEYHDDFNQAYRNWKESIEQFDNFIVTTMIQSQNEVLQGQKNYNEGIKNILSLRDNHQQNHADTTKLNSTIRKELMKELSNLSSMIRDQK
ncbi:hypothetical protein AKG98_3211 [Moritella sp. JT01]|uniref:hypothetical protein n=1 Tax=Moritella sp. JT01 TaxID=756698 RepID=UPI00079A19C8|nr:hypothetical protein [Moritella sp. JT01]KXO13412.1 hypothetical protein AKG98_3211 [Moritella sp. JT01]